jgi:hypothetical protein
MDLLVATKKKYEAKIAEAEAITRLYITKPVAVADHSEILCEIDRWLGVLAESKDRLSALNALFLLEDE